MPSKIVIIPMLVALVLVLGGVTAFPYYQPSPVPTQPSAVPSPTPLQVPSTSPAATSSSREEIAPLLEELTQTVLIPTPPPETTSSAELTVPNPTSVTVATPLTQTPPETAPTTEEEKIVPEIDDREKESEASQNSNLTELLAWTEQHEIKLVGVKGTRTEFLSKGHYDPTTDAVGLTKIPQTDSLFEGFKKIPPHLMQLLRNDTIYISIDSCMSQVDNLRHIFDPTFNPDDTSQLVFVPQGLFSSWGGVYLDTVVIFYCQPLNEYTTIHEIGHIVDNYGIGMNKGRDFLFGQTDEEIRILYDEYYRIFHVPENLSPPTIPPGFLTLYATTNLKENFAEHFAFYVVAGQEFREKAAQDPKLAEKYQFLKTKIFLEQEF